MYDDAYAGNQYYAEVGGIDVQELNSLESAFLRKMSWNLLIPEQNMKLIRSQLISLDYNPETNEFRFKKAVLGKATYKNSKNEDVEHKKRPTKKGNEIQSKNAQKVKTVVLTNYHSKTYRRHKHDDGDSCEAWKFLCSCEIIRKAWNKQTDEPKHEDKHMI